MFETYDNNFRFKLLMAMEKRNLPLFDKELKADIMILLPYAIKRRPLYIWREKM
jgi:hypothetical protein